MEFRVESASSIRNSCHFCSPFFIGTVVTALECFGIFQLEYQCGRLFQRVESEYSGNQWSHSSLNQYEDQLDSTGKHCSLEWKGSGWVLIGNPGIGRRKSSIGSIDR